MPRPTSATTVGRADLASLLWEFIERQDEFIGLKALPVFPVTKQTAQFPVIPIEALLSVPETRRAPRANYKRDDWEFEIDTYNCVENGWEEPVDAVEAKMYARFFDAEEVAAIKAMKTVLRVQENRIAAMLFNTSNFSAHAVTNEWDDGSNATPINDVKTGIATIRAATGLKPDTLIVSFSTFQDLGLCNQIVDRVKYTNAQVSRGQLPANLVAQALGVKRILIGDGVKNTAKKGQAASLGDIWDNEYAMLCVTSEGPDIKEPCVGRTFRWQDDSPDTVIVESYEEPQTRSQVIRARQHTDEEILIAASAYLLSNITT